MTNQYKPSNELDMLTTKRQKKPKTIEVSRWGFWLILFFGLLVVAYSFSANNTQRQSNTYRKAGNAKVEAPKPNPTPKPAPTPKPTVKSPAKLNVVGLAVFDRIVINPTSISGWEHDSATRVKVRSALMAGVFFKNDLECTSGGVSSFITQSERHWDDSSQGDIMVIAAGGSTRAATVVEVCQNDLSLQQIFDAIQRASF